MPDVFDQVAPSPAASTGDIFDHVSAPAAGPDIFDHVASDAPARALPAMPGNSLTFQPPGQPPIYAQEASREIARTPGLDHAGRSAVMKKWSDRAFGPVGMATTPTGDISGAAGLYDKAVQGVNAFEHGFVMDTALPIMRRLPYLDDVANRTEDYYRQNYGYAPTTANRLAEGTGSVAATIGLAGGPAAPVAMSAPIGGAIGGLKSYDAAREQGAPAGASSAHAAVGAATGAIPFPIAKGLSNSVLPHVGKSLAAQAAVTIPAMYAEQLTAGAVQTGLDNQIARLTYDPERPLTAGMGNLPVESIPGAVLFGGAAVANARHPQSHEQVVEQAGDAVSPGPHVTPPQGGDIFDAVSAAHTTPPAVADIRQQRLDELDNERIARSRQRLADQQFAQERPVTAAIEKAIDIFDRISPETQQDASAPQEARTPSVQPPTQQRASGEPQRPAEYDGPGYSTLMEDQRAMADEQAMLADRERRRAELSNMTAADVARQAKRLGGRLGPKDENVEFILRRELNAPRRREQVQELKQATENPEQPDLSPAPVDSLRHGDPVYVVDESGKVVDRGTYQGPFGEGQAYVGNGKGGRGWPESMLRVEKSAAAPEQRPPEPQPQQPENQPQGEQVGAKPVEQAAQAPGNVPDWVKEEMRQQGKNLDRLFNEVDVARPKFRELVQQDPLFAYAQAKEPDVAQKMLSGEITKQEYGDALGRSKQAAPPAQYRSKDPVTWTDANGKQQVGNVWWHRNGAVEVSFPKGGMGATIPEGDVRPYTPAVKPGDVIRLPGFDVRFKVLSLDPAKKTVDLNDLDTHRLMTTPYSSVPPDVKPEPTPGGQPERTPQRQAGEAPPPAEAITPGPSDAGEPNPFRPVWREGSGYTPEAFDVLVRDGINEQNAKNGIVQGKSGRNYELQVGDDEAGRPTIKAYREVAGRSDADESGLPPVPDDPFAGLDQPKGPQYAEASHGPGGADAALRRSDDHLAGTAAEGAPAKGAARQGQATGQEEGQGQEAARQEASAPAVPGPVGAKNDRDIAGMFRTMKGAVTDSYVDSMWQRVQRGDPIPRMGMLENRLRDAQKAGALRSRDDVARIVEMHKRRGGFVNIAPLEPAVKAVREAIAPTPQRTPFEDPAVEQRFEAARGVKKPGILEALAGKAGELKREITRHFVHLDTSNPQDAEAANILRLREAAQSNAPAKAKRDMEGWAGDLNPKEYDRFGRLLALPDILKDVDAGLYQGKELPFGFKSREHVEREMARLQRDADPKTLAAIEQRNAFTRDLTQRMVDAKLLKPEVLSDDRYFHRQVMEYMQQRESMTTGGQGPDVKLRQKGFQKARTGGGDFNTDYAQAEHEYLTHAYRQLATADALARIKARFDKSAELRKQYGNAWRDHLPEGYELWSPKPGNQFALVPTIPEAVVDQLLSYQKDIHDVTIRNALAKIPGEQYALPQRITSQLDQQPRQPSTGLAKMAESAMASWKQWVLLNPLKALKYNINNASGDVDAAFAADPVIFRHAKQSAMDLYRFAKGQRHPQLERAAELGVIGSGEALNEIPDIGDAGVFRRLAGGRMRNPVRWYWDKVRGGSALRENVTRLAAYRRALELIGAGKEPLWASKPSELAAIKNPQERAAKLSRDLLGDYGNISEAGQTIRQRYIPFWSWMEINAPRYVRLFRNAAAEGRGGRTGAAAAAGVARGVGMTAGKAAALYTLVHLFNAAVFPGQDDGFEDGRLRLLLGKGGDGRVFGVRFQGALSDALEWGGLNTLPGNIAKLSRGEAGVGDVAKDMAKSPVNKVANAALPIQKTIGEAAMGKSLYPDAFNPRPIRDRGEHLAGALDLDPLYRAAKGIPQPGIGEQAARTLLQVNDPGEGAYQKTRGAASDWLEKQGVPRDSGEPTERSNALFYYRKALSLEQPEAAAKWLQKYRDLGGTDKGMQQSMEKAHPLAGVPADKRQAFHDSLSPDQRDKLASAEQWYYRTYYGDASDSARRRVGLHQELAELEAKQQAFTDARQKLAGPPPQRDAARAAMLANRLKPQEAARLHKLRAIQNALRVTQKSQEMGRATEDQVRQRSERLLARAG